MIIGSAVPSYVDEEGVYLVRGAETFAEVALEVDNWRWSGTRFRAVPHLPFGDDDEEHAEPPANQLQMGLDGPYDFGLRLTGRAPGPPPHLTTRLARLTLTADLPAPDLPAYSRVLMGLLKGDSTLSVRGDEAEQEWRVATPVLRGWAEDLVPPQEHPVGSTGPPPVRMLDADL